MILLILCQLLMVGAPSNSNKLFGRLGGDTLGGVSSFLTETESARVFRRVASNCNQGHRRQVNGKMDQFKDLLEDIEQKPLNATRDIAQKISSLHRELRMSGLFAFEGPGILRRWIAEMRVLSVESQRKIPIVMAAITGLCEMEESANEGTKGFLDLLVQNSHRVFRDLVSPDFGDITHRAAALLLHEYLFRAVRKYWVTDLLYSTGELPEMRNIFSCEGSARDALRNLVENKGLILIHPFHWESMWSGTPIVHDAHWLDRVIFYGTQWVQNNNIGRGQLKLLVTELRLLVIIKAVENARETTFWRDGELVGWLQNSIVRSLSGHGQEDAPITTELFKVLMTSNLVGFSIVLRNVMTSDHHSAVFVNHRKHDNICRIHCKLLGTVVELLISGRLKTLSRYEHIECEWAQILSHIAMRWVNEYRRSGNNLMAHNVRLFMKVMESRSDRDAQLLFDDVALRLNEENLRKIQEAFPWLMPENFVQTLLLAQQQRMTHDLREGTTYDPESVLSFYE